jgi:hypothetical protein
MIEASQISKIIQLISYLPSEAVIVISFLIGFHFVHPPLKGFMFRLLAQSFFSAWMKARSMNVLSSENRQLFRRGQIYLTAMARGSSPAQSLSDLGAFHSNLILFSPLFLGSDQASCYLKKALKKY